MNNAPFHIGQKVVALRSWAGIQMPGYNKGDIYTVREFDKNRFPPIKYHCSFFEKNEYDFYCCEHFAPIETIYSDATNEILEKFPLEVGGTPDKIIAPVKVVTCD